VAKEGQIGENSGDGGILPTRRPTTPTNGRCP